MKNLLKFKKIFISILIISLIFLVSCGAKNIKLIDYVSVNFKGLDGKAKAEINIDSSGIIEKVLEAEGKKENSVDSIFTVFNIEDIDYEVAPNENLKNGDTVTVKIFPKGNNSENKKYKLIAGEKTYKVEGLEKGQIIDLFKDIEVIYDGVSPNAKVKIINNTNDPFLKTVNYYTDSYTVKKGEKIEIKAQYSEFEADEKKYIIDKDKKEYIVENLDEYLSKATDIDKETLEQIKKESQDIVDSYFANSITSVLVDLTDSYYHPDAKENLKTTSTLKQVNFLFGKDMNSFGDKNKIFLIYEISVSNKENPNPIKGYLSVKFNDAIKRTDGKIDIKYSDGRVEDVMKRFDDIERETLTSNKAKFVVEDIPLEK